MRVLSFLVEIKHSIMRTLITHVSVSVIVTNCVNKRTTNCNLDWNLKQATNYVIHLWPSLAAVGCSDLAPPSDSAWLKRVEDQITVGCYMSRQSWKLNCVNGVWTGTVGVCNDFQSGQSGSTQLISGKTTWIKINYSWIHFIETSLVWLFGQ